MEPAGCQGDTSAARVRRGIGSPHKYRTGVSQLSSLLLVLRPFSDGQSCQIFSLSSP